MAKLTIGLGVVLVALGLGGYIATGRESVTALIPAFFGGPLLLLGALALDERLRKHAMHLAVIVGVVGFAGAARGLLKLPALVTGGDVARPTAVAVQSAMAVLCLVFVLLCVRSFIKARRAGAAPQDQ